MRDGPRFFDIAALYVLFPCLCLRQNTVEGMLGHCWAHVGLMQLVTSVSGVLVGLLLRAPRSCPVSDPLWA